MDSESVNSSSSPAIEVPDAQNVSVSGQEKSTHGAPSLLSPSGISYWARSFRTPPSVIVAQEESETGNDGNSDSAQASNGNDVQTSTVYGQEKSATDTPSLLSPSGISAWARNLGIPTPSAVAQENSQNGHDGRTNFARFTNRLALTLSKVSTPDENSTASDSGVLESFKKGLVDSSRNAVKAVQVKARHIVSQNKRRYQEGGFDLDMSYITENIIAMGFPAGDMSSGIFGYLEGFYRNHMEEVIEFLETNHKGKYKVYNLCSERLYDASLFEGKVASFPFDDHNCPPMELILPFCQSAYSWLKGDIENVVVVHCKAGMARTGLMISSLLVFMKFFPTAEESIDYFNQKRCLDGKGLVLPSQIRYVKYFECILTQFDGECPTARRCMLRGFRLHKCPFWIRPSITISNHKGILFSTKKHPKTKNLMPEDFWISAPKKGILVFALPREPGVAELTGDFKIHFHDRQGDFYCWLNTSMMENRITLNTCDLDGFEKRNVPCPGFQIDVVMIDYKGDVATSSQTETNSNESGGNSSASKDGAEPTSNQNKSSGDDDDVFSDNESEGSGSSRRRRQSQAPQSAGPATSNNIDPQTGVTEKETAEQISLTSSGPAEVPKGEAKNDGISAPVSNLQVPKLDTMGANEIKAIAADASVFSFGDEDEESD